MINKKIRNKRKIEIEVHALGYILMSPHKARRALNQIRGRSYMDALLILGGMPYEVAYPLLKILLNVGENSSYARGYDKFNLKITKVEVNKGTTGKKWKLRARGRSCPIKRPACRIRIVVKDISLHKENFSIEQEDFFKICDLPMLIDMYSPERGV